MSLSLYYTDVQCVRATGEQHESKKVDVTVEDTTEEHNITVDNPSTASKEEEKVKPLINDYSEWIADGLLKHHAGRYCQQQPKVFRNEECLINIIKGLSISAGLPWHLDDEVYIQINYGDAFHWVLAVVVLKERCIRVYDSMSRRRRQPLSDIQKLTKILPTYLDISGFLDEKVRTDWSTIEAYLDKKGNPFDVQYFEGIAQHTIGSL
ncbi:hypothetical protein T459_25533 [Capsicum annuum]|uniref:Ubiquitin-like protease family profile domain-containing protein n=1 Tax=Capsicum annuum TaxID=4072 RepID=A0A2G2YL21_CAPAN|nr:hypothetical protein FXO37_18186 [Capsicum annuum]PHT70429.1 hypothetical protein T459_25533 [Capsicum annuum]